jgi:hypothetical protein
MRDVQDASDEATISLILGKYLNRRRHNQSEGCPLVMRAAQIRHELGLPGEEEALAAARDLGCIGSGEEPEEV